MNLESSRLHVRWYVFSLLLWSKFTTTGHRWERFYEENRSRTTLCYFMRVSIVYGPLVLLMHTLAYGGTALAFIILPLALLGPVYFLMVGAVIGVGTVLVCFVGLMVYGSEMVSTLKKDVQTRYSDIMENPHPKNFAVLTLQYLVAVKNKYCPIIRIEETR